jgi:hypothetical protein
MWGEWMSRYYPDKERIEDAIPLVLMAQTIDVFMEESRRNGGDIHKDNDSLWLYKVFSEECLKPFKGLDAKKAVRLRRRAYKVLVKLSEYMTQQEMNGRKRTILIAEWMLFLHNAGGIVIEDDSDYAGAVFYILDEIEKRRLSCTDFARVEESARKQLEKLHKLCQEEGYY